MAYTGGEIVEENFIYDNGTGIRGSEIARGNTVYGNTVGLHYQDGAEQFLDNVVYGNSDGIYGGGLISGNRVYNNSNSGITVWTATEALNNQVYSNNVGIRSEGTYASFSGQIANNVVYDNTNAGVMLKLGSSIGITNNTIYQPVGDAIRLENVSSVRVRNNILVVDAGHCLSLAADALSGFSSDYNLLQATGGGELFYFEDISFSDQQKWFYKTGSDRNSLVEAPGWVDANGADDVLGYDAATNTDGGLDDDFHLQPGVRAIDGGDPASYYLSEPEPNGDRINIGAYGNTAEAAASPQYVIQVLSPNGYEKFESGQVVPVSWQSAGLTEERPVALINAGGGLVGRWQSDAFGVNTTAGSFSDPVDTSAVEAPAPEAIYQSYVCTNYTYSSLSYMLPVPDGEYTLRLHFAKPKNTNDAFDIRLQGTVVASDYNVYTAAGEQFNKAVIEEYTVVVTAGEGISLELVRKNGDCILSGIEVLAANQSGSADPTVDLELSLDGGQTWSTITTGRPVDRLGRGTYDWTATSETDAALIRVRANQGTQPQDVSDKAFLIANSGTAYYVNLAGDADLTDNEYTSVTGNDANSGKRPDAPMATLQALIATYDLEPGDVVYVDTGVYVLSTNLVIGDEDSGVRLQGPIETGHSALLDRADGNYGVIVYGEDVTLDHLTVQHATYAGIYGSGCDDLLISNCEVSWNGRWGIRLNSPGDGVTIRDSRIIENAKSSYPQWKAIEVAGAVSNLTIADNEIANPRSWAGLYVSGYPISGVVISGNEIHSHKDSGVYLQTSGTLVTGNYVYGNDIGIYGGEIVEENFVYDNGTGIHGSKIARGNTVYGNTVGLHYQDGSEQFLDNVVYSNSDGIYGGALISGNRVYNNSNSGITVWTATEALNNHVYSNNVGIRSEGTYASFSGQIANNVVYDNTNAGVMLKLGSSIGIANNTIYQPVGDAIRLENVSSVRVRNNILVVDAGHCLSLAADALSGFSSDYNLFWTGPAAAGNVAEQGTDTAPSLADWQTLSGQDNHSVLGAPRFVDINGADDVLGYDPTAYKKHGGDDDNLHLYAGSPAIDRGSAWDAPSADVIGLGRADDPGTPNTGSPDYFESSASSIVYEPLAVGAAMNWQADDWYWSLALPFGFSFFDNIYNDVWVTSNGLLQFGSSSSLQDAANSVEKLADYPRIAPMWDDLTTAGAGDDIYVDSSVTGQIMIRWDATNKADGSDVNFAVILYDDGVIHFEYGPGNANLSPTVGIGRGDGRVYRPSAYDGRSSFASAEPVEFALAPSYADFGAYEFGGSSHDTSPPTIVATQPAAIGQGGYCLPFGVFAIEFGEAINPIDAVVVTNFELRDGGTNGIFGDTDDTVYALAPEYYPGDTIVTIYISGGALPDGNYRLTVSGDTSIHDLAGLRLDGDEDGSPGGDYVRTFTVDDQPPQFTSQSSFTVPENSTAIGIVSSNESVAGLTLSGGADQALFSLADHGDGTASLEFLAPPDFESPRDSDEDNTYLVEISATDLAGNTSQQLIGVTVIDVADTPGITVNPTSGLTTTEAGGTAQFTVVLDSPPTAEVTIYVYSNAPTEGTVSPDSLTFTADNWSVAKTVTIAGVDDLIDDGDMAYSIIVAAAISSDANYDGMNANDVLVTNIDNDASVAARHVFYNNSGWDGSSSAAGTADDQAVDTSKEALLPAGMADSSHFTNFSKGITGVMVDIQGLADPVALGVGDFAFRMGTDSNVAQWDPAPVPLEVNVRQDAGQNGSDRVTLTWENGTIVNCWLQIEILANTTTGLPSSDVFYFGNLVADVDGNGTVNVLDASPIIGKLSQTASSPDLAADVDRSGTVNVLDASPLIGALSNTLAMIQVPQTVSTSGAPGLSPVSEDAPTVQSSISDSAEGTELVSFEAERPQAAGTEASSNVAAVRLEDRRVSESPVSEEVPTHDNTVLGPPVTENGKLAGEASPTSGSSGAERVAETGWPLEPNTLIVTDTVSQGETEKGDAPESPLRRLPEEADIAIGENSDEDTTTSTGDDLVGVEEASPDGRASESKEVTATACSLDPNTRIVADTVSQGETGKGDAPEGSLRRLTEEVDLAIGADPDEDTTTSTGHAVVGVAGASPDGRASGPEKVAGTACSLELSMLNVTDTVNQSETEKGDSAEGLLRRLTEEADLAIGVDLAKSPTTSTGDDVIGSARASSVQVTTDGMFEIGNSRLLADNIFYANQDTICFVASQCSRPISDELSRGSLKPHRDEQIDLVLKEAFHMERGPHLRRHRFDAAIDPAVLRVSQMGKGPNSKLWARAADEFVDTFSDSSETFERFAVAEIAEGLSLKRGGHRKAVDMLFGGEDAETDK